MMTSELNWVNCVLEDIGVVVTGKTPSTKDTANFGGTIPFVKPGDLNFGGYITFTADTLSEKGFSLVPRLPKNAIMVTCIGNLGKVGITSMPSATNQQINSVVPHQQVNSKYLYYFLLTIQSWLEKESSATTVSIINKGKFSKAPIKLPPLAEQQQIAAKLDELLAQVDNLKTRLDNIPKILKRFRQSVLAAAVSGKLTEDFRSDTRYSKTELGLSIPYDWDLLVIDDIAEVKGGKRLPKGEVLVSENTGYRYIRAGQLKNGTVVEDNQLFLLKHVQAKISNYIVNSGDLYITIVGACIGDAGIIPTNYSGANLTENAAKLCLFKKPLEKLFFSHWLRSQFLQDIIHHEIKSGAQGKLALKRIKTLPFPYPKIEEQTEIVARVEQLFALADQIEQRVKDAQSRVNHLTQAILAKAFRGELTADWRAQNPDLISGENSAEALLSRIKAEREMVAKPKKTGKKANA